MKIVNNPEKEERRKQAALQYVRAMLDAGTPLAHAIADARSMYGVEVEEQDLTIPAPKPALHEKHPTRRSPWAPEPETK